MRRKVIQIADSTQLVSLPRKWALKYGIKKGDELELSESADSLMVTLPSHKKEEKKLELSISDSKKFLRRMLFSPYIQGYTEIKVNYSDSKVFDLISNEVQLLMGYEIITQGANHCIIKSVATALDDDLDNIIQRIFLSTASMMVDLAAGLKKHDLSKLDTLRLLELTNNKLSYLCLRILNKDGYADSNKTNSIYYTILCIEEIVDDLRDICAFAVKNKAKAEKQTITLLEKCIDYFRFVNELFRKFESERLFDLNRGIKELTKELTDALKKSNSDTVILSYLHNIINKISHISKEIHY